MIDCLILYETGSDTFAGKRVTMTVTFSKTADDSTGRHAGVAFGPSYVSDWLLLLIGVDLCCRCCSSPGRLFAATAAVAAAH